MPRGDKSAYTDKQDRKADHIAEGYENKGVSEKEAERRAWATVNKDDGGGKKSGSGRGADTAIPPLTKAENLAARPPLAVPPPNALRQPKRPRRRASETRETTRITSFKSPRSCRLHADPVEGRGNSQSCQ